MEDRRICSQTKPRVFYDIILIVIAFLMTFGFHLNLMQNMPQMFMTGIAMQCVMYYNSDRSVGSGRCGQSGSTVSKSIMERSRGEKKMKKTLIAVLIVLMSAALLSSCFAQAPTSITTLVMRDVYFNKNTNTLMMRDPDSRLYRFADAYGNFLTEDTYTDAIMRETDFEVAMAGGRGIIDGYTGSVLVPCLYRYVERLSSRWGLGVNLKPATEENYDYKSTDYNTGDRTYYLVTTYDVYYRGTLVGELDRLDYERAYAYGDYLRVRNRAGKYVSYDRNFTRSPYEGNYSDEYDEVRGVIYHTGSGQAAFTAGCTLTPEEVSVCFREMDGRFVDLQGNTTGPCHYYSCYGIKNNRYARVRQRDKLYGVTDVYGNEIVPCIYEDVYEGGFAGGYVAVKKDGLLGYVNESGELTCEFTYNYDNARIRGPFATFQDMTGGVVVVSAEGLLPDSYADVSMNNYSGYYGEIVNPCFAAQDKNGNVGVVNIYGETIIPFDNLQKYPINYDISLDGSTIVVRGEREKIGVYNYLVYHFDAPEKPVADSAAAGTGTETTQSADGWVCSECGANCPGGRFCYMCGAERVMAQFCSECGNALVEGARFCTECGTKVG